MLKFILVLALTIIDVFVPEPIPVVDEILLAIWTYRSYMDMVEGRKNPNGQVAYDSTNVRIESRDE